MDKPNRDFEADQPPHKRARLDGSRPILEPSRPAASFDGTEKRSSVSPAFRPPPGKMAGSGFQIPGLGMPIGDNPYPAQNFAPDVLAAAASICGDEASGVGDTNTPQWEQSEKKGGKEGETEERRKHAPAAGETVRFQVQGDGRPELRVSEDKMDVDVGEKEAHAATQLRDGHKTASDAESKPDASGQEEADSPPGVTDALEAALNGLLPPSSGGEHDRQISTTQGGEEGQHPEWEEDSSPYESSSESSSSDSSSDDDESEDGGAYPLLGAEETAKLLLAAEEDGEDGDKKDWSARGYVRTKNEMPEAPLPRPEVVITPEMKIELLGYVSNVVENTLVIRSRAPGEVQVLDAGSVLCKEDRTVIGALAETLGSVRNPAYAVSFGSEEEIRGLGVDVGTAVYYSVEHANYVFVQALKATKGSDASNLHDEEVGADEIEFSDDEKEAEYKRQLKAKRRGGKTGRGGREKDSHAHLFRNELSQPNAKSTDGLNYDEDDDGPYKPLARPPGFAQGLPESLPAPPSQAFGHGPGGHGHGGPSRGGRRGDFRGGRHQGHRGGRGDRRSSGHGGWGGYSHDKTASSNHDGFPQVPRGGEISRPPGPPLGTTPTAPSQWPAGLPGFPAPPPYSNPQPRSPPPPPPAPNFAHFNFNFQGWNANQNQAAQPYQFRQGPQQPPSGYPQAPAPPAWPGLGQASPPAGAYNPAFFPGLHAAVPPPHPPPPQQTGQGYQQQQSPYWSQQGGNAYGQR